jgi:hypothetical protein
MRAEGWYEDPYDRHVDRWFSDGEPTSLVRDGESESRDEPPNVPPPMPLVESQPGRTPAQGIDLQRADDPGCNQPYSAAGVVRAILDDSAEYGVMFS